MGELRIAGDGAHEYLQARLSNDLDRIDAGAGAVHPAHQRRRGNRRRPDRLPPRRRRLPARRQRLQRSRRITPRSSETETSRTSGRSSPSRARRRSTAWASRSSRSRSARTSTSSASRCLVAGTGYTGERGCELGCAPGRRSAPLGRDPRARVVPCGLGARDTLRLEVCYPLHGNDITPERTPIEAGLGWACSLDKEFHRGRALATPEGGRPDEKLVAFVMEDAGIPRDGDADRRGRRGHLRDALADARGGSIGLGYVSAGARGAGHRVITIDLRGRPRRARIVPKPFYKREEA